MIRSTPEQLGLREHDTRIDQDGRIPAGDHHHVHAELAEAAERNESRVAASGVPGVSEPLIKRESQR